MSGYEANEALLGRAGTTVTLEVLLPLADADAGPTVRGGESPAATTAGADARVTEPPPPPPPLRSRHVTLVRVRGFA